MSFPKSSASGVVVPQITENDRKIFEACDDDIVYMCREAHAALQVIPNDLQSLQEIRHCIVHFLLYTLKNLNLDVDTLARILCAKPAEVRSLLRSEMAGIETSRLIETLEILYQRSQGMEQH
jgi:hypothetical protein